MNRKIFENAQNYCNKNVFKLGTSKYYSFITLNQNKKDAIASIISFYEKIFDISKHNKNKDISLVKINWWKKEINNIYEKKPSHPISIALLNIIKKYKIEKKFFFNIIKGSQLNLNNKQYKSLADLKRLFYYSYISIAFLILRILECTEKNYIYFANYISISIHLIKIIKNLGKDLRLKKLYVPREYIEKIDQNLYKNKNQRDLKQLLNVLKLITKYVQKFYKIGINKINTREKKIKSIMILSSIYMDNLKQIENENFDILNQEISITPIKKIFILYKYK